MQIKANTAGRDYFSIIKGYKHTPSSSYLYNPSNNIEVAAGYLRILATRYLSGIKHPKKLEYAMISSYNGGAGNLWRSLDKNGNKTKSLARINNMTVSEFYWFLTNRHIRGETRNYLKKVSGKQKKYLHL
jgi:membrane-bound lytic murein transglycosylase C